MSTSASSAELKISSIQMVSTPDVQENLSTASRLIAAAAAAGADWFSVPGMGISLVEQKGEAAWPITGASFVLMYKEPTDKQASKDVIKFFNWAFKDGKQLALDLDYVPLPDVLTQAIADKVWSQIKH